MITKDALGSHKIEWMGLNEKLQKNLLHVGDSQRNALLLLKLSSSASVSYFVLHQHSDTSSCKAWHCKGIWKRNVDSAKNILSNFITERWPRRGRNNWN